jgi:hypothetical protein
MPRRHEGESSGVGGREASPPGADVERLPRRFQGLLTVESCAEEWGAARRIRMQVRCAAFRGEFSGGTVYEKDLE